MSSTNEFSVQMNKNDAEQMLAGIARLTGGMTEMFGMSDSTLTDSREAGQPYSPAREWIVENYETAAGATALIYSASEILLRVFQDKNITITD